jgi:hypothetical protein
MAPAEGKPATTPAATQAGPSAANAPDNKPPVDREQKSKP